MKDSQDEQYRLVHQPYETASSSITSPSGKLTMSLRVNALPAPSSNGPGLKQTVVEIYETETQELISERVLEGYMLMSTPFAPPQWSPDEKHILFSFVSNHTIGVLTKILEDVFEEGKDDDGKKDDGKKDEKKIDPKLTPEDVIANLFTDTRYQTHMDLGEQLNNIQYPYLMVYSVHGGAVTTVHDLSYYSTFMPTFFQWAPQSTTINNDTYPIIYAAQPIFPHRFGTIFYSTRPSRLYLSLVQLEQKVEKESDGIENDKMGDKISEKQVPKLANKTPIIFCLTPDAHCVHGLEVYNHNDQEYVERYEQIEKEKQNLAKKPPQINQETPDTPTMFKNDQHVDITYFEGQAYDDRWGASDELVDLVVNHVGDSKMMNQDKELDKSEIFDLYMYQNKNIPRAVAAEFLTPHGTTLGLRLIRLKAKEYDEILIDMEIMRKQMQQNDCTKSENITTTIIQSKSKPINDLYLNSLPQWPLEAGLQSTFSKNIANYEQSYILVPQSSKQALLRPQTLLPVNPYSYGVCMAGNANIYRLDGNTVAYNSSLRDIDIIVILKYTIIPDKVSKYTVKMAILLPDGVSPEDFAKVQLNQETPIGTPQNGPNCNKLMPLLKDGENYTPVLKVVSDPTKRDQRVSYLPKLPIRTDLDEHVKAQGDEVVERLFTNDNNSYDYHYTIPSLSLLDLRFYQYEHDQYSFLIKQTGTSDPTCIKTVRIDLSENERGNKNSSFAFSHSWESINKLFCPSLKFHTTPENIKLLDNVQVYTPGLITAVPFSVVEVQKTTLSKLQSELFSTLNTITVEIQPYNSFGQAQALVTYDETLFELRKGIKQARCGMGKFTDVEKKTKKEQNESKKNPNSKPRGVILWPHGGPHSNFTNMYDSMTNFFASNGYIVIKINYSGSPSYGEVSLRSLMGYIGYMDTTECIHTVDTVKYLFGIEQTGQTGQNGQTGQTGYPSLSTHYFGGSHSGFLGGFITIYRKFDTAVLRNSVFSLNYTGTGSDIADWVFSCLGMIYQTDKYFHSDQFENQNIDNFNFVNHNNNLNRNNIIDQNYPINNLQNLMSFLSPISYIHHIKTPTLLGIGGSDKRVPCLQSNIYSRVLAQNKIHTAINFYPSAQHGLNDTPQILAHSFCSAMKFFKQFEQNDDNDDRKTQE
jgi:acetyl esterase/lipase